MATLRSDVIIPEVFTPYVLEQTTLRDAFLASGVVQPMAELNATEGGDYVNIPFWKANLTGDFEVLSDSTSLTPGKITADKQVGVILHRGRAFESRDLAALAAGADPMAAIGAKVAEYVANQRQKDLLACLAGVFGPIGSSNARHHSPVSPSMAADLVKRSCPLVTLHALAHCLVIKAIRSAPSVCTLPSITTW
jgi:hypothetical protein